MIKWERDIQWKVYFPKEKTYIMRDHNWAFAAWEIERLKGRLNKSSVLFHVDSHLDDCPDGVLVNGLLEANTVEKILSVAESYDREAGQTSPSNIMQIDNFIWAALARGTIEEVFYISRDKQDVVTLKDLQNQSNASSELILSKLPSDCKYRHSKFNDLESFLNLYTPESKKISWR